MGIWQSCLFNNISLNVTTIYIGIWEFSLLGPKLVKPSEKNYGIIWEFIPFRAMVRITKVLGLRRLVF